MKALTIKDLKKICNEEIKKGNGNKSIMISADDEGNSYHYLWYGFDDAKELIEDTYTVINERIAKIENTVCLG